MFMNADPVAGDTQNPGHGPTPTPTNALDVAKMGKALRSYATHHNHGEGWTYTRDTKGMQSIRYTRDDNLWKRIKWTLHMLKSLGDHSLFRPQGARDWYNAIRATIRVNLRRDTNMPDGTLNDGIVIVVWEEDGEYIEWVGPTVGAKIADFLEAEPAHPHAVAIATEMRRVRQLGIDRRKQERANALDADQ